MYCMHAGELLGLIDSRVDMSHCSFYDPALPSLDSFRLTNYSATNHLGHTVTVSEQLPGYQPLYRMPAHRKVVAYFGYAGGPLCV